eukprot:365344-Chlamydomonas_euryale.AAC.15
MKQGMRINEDNANMCYDRIKATMDKMSERLASSKFLVGNSFTAADLTFSSMAALLVQTKPCQDNYGAKTSVLAEVMPEALLKEMRESRAGQHCTSMYESYRQPRESDSKLSRLHDAFKSGDRAAMLAFEFGCCHMYTIPKSQKNAQAQRNCYIEHLRSMSDSNCLKGREALLARACRDDTQHVEAHCLSQRPALAAEDHVAIPDAEARRHMGRKVAVALLVPAATLGKLESGVGR